jgi:hypothetical protein
MAAQESDRSDDLPRCFTPSFPFFLVYGDGKPVVGSDGGTKFVMACASLELGELVTAQFKEAEPKTRMGLNRIADFEVFSDVARQLIEHGVTHMSWNATRRSKTINIVDLADFVTL